MLLSFRVGNHRSLWEEQQLNLTPVYEADRPEGTAWEAVPVAAVFGANAAGKSNVVDALRFMRHMVVASHREAEPGGGIERKPFALDSEGAESASWYVVDLALEGVRHTYGFSIDSDRVVDEWLYSYPHGRRRKIFQRDENGISFGDAVPEKELQLVGSITEPNTLFMSVAARSRQESVLPVYMWFSHALSIKDRPLWWASSAATGLLSDVDRAASVVSLLRAADLGIEDAGLRMRFVDVKTSRSKGGTVTWTFRDLAKDAGPGTDEADMWQEEVWIAQRGRNGVTRLGLGEQSEGTRMLLAYSGPVLDALDTGGLLVIDEVDASLHPKLTAHLIKLFQEPQTNPHGAQLILTTHDASLLGRSGGEEILKRDQVWFVEKNEYGETSLFPLSDFKPRQEENRERRYLGGSYGAVPFLSDERFEAAVAARGRTNGEETGE
ncbi:ATP-binding protein [Streptomyces xiamenensis]|uniref:AAA family ATPase n=1 Tax=Streptomyces xiamenensis TaxID=408015 RepID=UPI00341D1EC8